MIEGNPFTFLFDDVVADVGLIPAAVYGVVWRYCQRRDKECYASQTTLAKHLGITRQTLNAHLAVLVEAGYVVDVTPERDGQTHTYHLTEKRSGGLLTVEEEVPVKEIDSLTEPVKEFDSTCKDSLHPPVKNLDTRNTSEDYKKDICDAEAASRARPVAQPEPPPALIAVEKIRITAVRTAARVYFEEQTHLKIPEKGQAKALGRLWWNPIREICDLANQDLNVAKQIINLALQRMEGLTVSDPNSIIKTARAVAAEKNRPKLDKASGELMQRMQSWG